LIVLPVIRRRWRISAALSVLALVALAAVAGLFAPLDGALRSARFELADRAPSGEMVLVEIDAASLQKFGVWPWPRRIHAEVLDRLMTLGAAEVVFDIDFSTASNEADDSMLEGALERAGGYAFLAAFAQTTANGTVVINEPLPRFAAHADPVLVNVDGDGTHLTQSLPARLVVGAEQITAVAARLEPAMPAPDRIFIDFGIDLTSIDRISVADLLGGRVDPGRIADKQVVVGSSAVELRDFFRVPRFGVISGPMVQVAATETLKAGRSLTELGQAPASVLSMLLAFAMFLGRKRLRLGGWLLLALLASVAVEAMACLVQMLGAVTLDTAVFHATGAACLLLAMLRERAARWNAFIHQQGRLLYLATHDAFTGAFSRQALVDQVNAHLLAGRGQRITVVRLERLDSAIASLGHAVGEAVAVEVAERLEKVIGNTPARLGTDLFGWSQPDLPDSVLQMRLLGVLGALVAPYAVGGHVVVLDPRFGSSLGSVADQTAEDLLRQAEVALSTFSSEPGKTAVFDPEHDRRAKQRRFLDVALRQALERGEFFLLYQPQHDLRTGEMIGVEALVRWQSGELGLVSPADFIPLAEETGLIVELGAWVLERACREAMQWTWSGRLSVNVSVEQFRLGNIVETVRAALARTNFPPERLDLEITESLFASSDSKLVADLEALRSMGIGIALDDFGTGYSSLSYLTTLPIDKLKIDQSFVRQLPHAQKEVLVETIVLMARRLGKTIVAEGIETTEQRDYLANLACDMGQGYLFGKPSRPEQLGLSDGTRRAA
jgi:predicted signal transduction protein with EAL and GGDEF domain